MFSYSDLVRMEVAVEVGERFGVDIPDQVAGGWLTLGDVARSVVALTAGVATEAEVFGWVRGLVADGYGVPGELAPDEAVFADYDRMTGWFMALPYPHHLGERWFARQRGAASGSPDAEQSAAPDSAHESGAGGA